MSKRNNLGILGNYWGKKGKLKSKRDSFLNNEVIKFRMNIKGESTDIKNKLKLLLSKVHTVLFPILVPFFGNSKQFSTTMVTREQNV